MKGSPCLCAQTLSLIESYSERITVSREGSILPEVQMNRYAAVWEIL